MAVAALAADCVLATSAVAAFAADFVLAIWAVERCWLAYRSLA
jgi:hypothetical protein